VFFRILQRLNVGMTEQRIVIKLNLKMLLPLSLCSTPSPLIAAGEHWLAPVMIFKKPKADLQHSIDKMGLPVFVIDQDRDGEFRLTALNRSHSKSTGLKLEAVADKTPQMILPKRKDADFLTNRYRTCMRERKPIIYSTRLTYSDEVKDIRTTLHPVSVDGHAVELTAFEFRLLEYLMLRAGEVLSKTELAEHLYAEEDDRDSNVVEVLVGRLRRKLDPEQQLSPIETLRGRGYRFRLSDAGD